MDDLTKCLYDFVCDHRMGRIHQDPEYREIANGIELQTQRLQKDMNKEQLRELQLLMDNLLALSDIESEHLFQAALGLARELGRAV